MDICGRQYPGLTKGGDILSKLIEKASISEKVIAETLEVGQAELVKEITVSKRPNPTVCISLDPDSGTFEISTRDISQTDRNRFSSRQVVALQSPIAPRFSTGLPKVIELPTITQIAEVKQPSPAETQASQPMPKLPTQAIETGDQDKAPKVLDPQTDLLKPLPVALDQPGQAQPILVQPALDTLESTRLALAQPSVKQPALAQPVVQPALAQPVVQPALAQPVVQPALAQPVVQPALAQPVVQPALAQPVVQPALAQPVVQPALAQPVVPQSVFAQPVVPQSVIAQPVMPQSLPALTTPTPYPPVMYQLGLAQSSVPFQPQSGIFSQGPSKPATPYLKQAAAPGKGFDYASAADSLNLPKLKLPQVSVEPKSAVQRLKQLPQRNLPLPEPTLQSIPKLTEADARVFAKQPSAAVVPSSSSGVVVPSLPASDAEVLFYRTQLLPEINNSIQGIETKLAQLASPLL